MIKSHKISSFVILTRIIYWVKTYKLSWSIFIPVCLGRVDYFFDCLL